MVSFSDLLAMSQSTTQASALEAEAAQKQKAAKLAEEKKKQVERERREAEIARKQREKYFEEQRLEKEREEKARIRREEREERKRKEQEEQAKQIKSGPKYPSSRASSSSSSKPRTHRPKAHSDSDDDDLAAGAHALTRDEIKARRLQAQKLREFGSSSARKTASVRGSGHGKKLKGGAYNIVDEHPEALAQGPGNIRDRAKASAGKLISLGKVKNEAGSEGRPGRSALEFSAKKTLSGWCFPYSSGFIPFSKFCRD
ncbi:hypothetical protein DL96DRAFT_853641 [Flagelloscypha sp. PMI_526]|nr:hypothetical protein DL96DRAFT_853641 [Flagelloscypha sp. PMI_526]